MILILGGTEHARCLSNIILADLSPQYPDLQITYSLAGITPEPLLPEAHPCLTIKQGGFGGRQGLQDYLQRHDIRLVINATHAFTDSISSNALQATQNLTLPYLRYQKSPWLAEEYQQTEFAPRIFADMPGMMAALLAHINHHFTDANKADEKFSVLVALGVRALQYLQPLFNNPHASDCLYYLRVIRPLTEEEQKTLPKNCHVLIADLPFTTAKEQALLQEYHIQMILCRNSGSDAGRHKLQVAQKLKIPVMMLAQNINQQTQNIATVENDAQCVEFIKQHVI